VRKPNRAALVTDFLGYSGGDLVSIVIAKALFQAGYVVDIYTDNQARFYKACAVFKQSSVLLRDLRVVQVHLPSPYFYVPCTLLNIRGHYDVVVYADDIPRTAPRKAGVRQVTYVHFPHSARVKFNILVDAKYSADLSGRVKWRIHRLALRRLFYVDAAPPLDHILLANSTLTSFYIAKLWSCAKSEVLYPPVQARWISDMARARIERKKDQVAYAGRIMPGRGIEEIITAMAMTRDLQRNVCCKLVGPVIDERYGSYLSSMIRKAKLERVVELAGLVCRDELARILIQSKVLVHPVPYEPFGIVVVEGMASGCIPIVKRGFNGPWLDILKGCEEHGYSYVSPNELAEKILTALYAEPSTREDVMNYSLRFDEESFTQGFLRLLRDDRTTDPISSRK